MVQHLRTPDSSTVHRESSLQLVPCTGDRLRTLDCDLLPIRAEVPPSARYCYRAGGALVFADGIWDGSAVTGRDSEVLCEKVSQIADCEDRMVMEQGGYVFKAFKAVKIPALG